MDSTRERIMDAAERLFADAGYGASLRDITAAAGANLAAVSYHFGGKEELLVAVVLRRIEAANEQRLEALDALEAAGDPSVEDLIEVFLRPALELAAKSEQGAHFMRLIGRIHGDPDGPWRKVLGSGAFDVIQQRFMAAFRGALPKLSDLDLLWRIHTMIGAMVHTLLNPEVLLAYSVGRCDPRDPDLTLGQLVPFLAAGFRAQPRS